MWNMQTFLRMVALTILLTAIGLYSLGGVFGPSKEPEHILCVLRFYIALVSRFLSHICIRTSVFLNYIGFFATKDMSYYFW